MEQVSPVDAQAIFSEPPPPRRLGDYDLIREIARGGMGVVWLAVQRSLGRHVAIKLLPAGRSSDPMRLARFRAEATMAARLQHPQIVSIHDIGDDAGVPYYSMDFVPGQDLGSLARRRPLNPKDAAALVRTVALAIQYAHDQGILHRDLKPSNVLVTPSGEPRVTDFGLAKLMEPDASLTQSGEILGSPCFMAPEQVAARKRSIDNRTDVYGLGGLLYFALTGQPPFSGDSISATLQAVLTSEPLPPRRFNPEIPPEMEEIVMRCLAKDPANRYPSAASLAADLERALRGQPLQSRAPGRALRFKRWAIREPGLAVLGSTSIFLLGILLIGAVFVMNHQEDARRLESQRSAELAINRYIADVSLAARALGDGDVRTASRLLDGLESSSPMAELRGLEWYLLRQRCIGRTEEACWEGKDPVLDAIPTVDHRQVALVTASRFRLVPADGGFVIADHALPGPVRQRRLATSLDPSTAWIGDDLGLHRIILTTGLTQTVLKHPIVDLASRQDGKLLALEIGAGDPQERIVVLSADDLRPKGEIAVTRPVSMAWSDQGDLNVLDARGRVWRWTSKRGFETEAAPTTEEPYIEIAIAANRQRRVVVDAQGLLRIENLVDGTSEYCEQLDRWAGVRLFLNPDGTRLVQVGAGGDQRLILREGSDWHSRRFLHGLTDRVGNLRFLPAQQGFLTASADGSVRNWRWEAVTMVGAWRDLPTTDRLGTPVFAPDGKWLAVGYGESPHGASRIWAVADPYAPPIRLPGRTIGFAPTGTATLQWRESGLIEVWDFAARRRLSAFQLNPLPCQIPDQVSRDGSFFACLGRDAHLRIFHGHHGRELPGPVAKVRSFELAPNGHFVAFAMPGGVGLFKPGSGDQYQFAMGEPTSLTISPESRYVCAGFSSGRLVVHDVQEGKTLADIAAQPTPISAMAFVADSRTLLTGSEDGELRFWNVPSWREVTRLRLPSAVRILVGRPNHRAILAASDKEIRLVGNGVLERTPLVVQVDGGFWEDPLRSSERMAARNPEPLPASTVMR